MMSYNPALTMGVWLGNPDTTVLKNGTSSLGSPIIASTMKAAADIYTSEGKYTANQWYTAPNGIQRIGNEVYPSWWSKTQGQANATLTFDKLSKKKATDCTPEAAKITLDVVKTTDPVSKKDAYSNVPDGYIATDDDDIHKCSDTAPSISTISVSGGGNSWTINVVVNQGTFSIDGSGVSIVVNGQTLTATKNGSAYSASYSGSSNPTGSINVKVTDTGYYTASKSG